MSETRSVQERIRQDKDFRDTLLDWMRANGIDPNHVPADERPSLVDGKLTLRMFTLTAEGKAQIDPLRSYGLLTHTVTVPITVQPNAEVLEWLIPPCAACGR